MLNKKMGFMFIGVFVMFYGTNLFADVVYLDGGRRVEGRIVEERNDALVVEMLIGKVTIEKESVINIERDSQEKNFVEMGNYYFDRRNYDTAINYYFKALEVNPDYVEAQRALAKAEAAKAEKTEKGIIVKQNPSQSIARNKELPKGDYLGKFSGLELVREGSKLYVVGIEGDSSFEKAGIEEGDLIKGINGTAVKDMTVSKIKTELSSAKPPRLLIERKIDIVRQRIKYKERTFVGIGVFVKKEKDKFFVGKVIEEGVAYSVGVKTGDEITEINGNSLAGLSFDNVEALMMGEDLSTVNVGVTREVKIE
ncbi:MAG: PDZ domain-containing protein [Candidatus Omnitrophota bacterium]